MAKNSKQPAFVGDNIALSVLNDIELVRYQDQFYRYEGTVWRPLDKDAERRLAHEAIRKVGFNPRISWANEVLDALRARCDQIAGAPCWRQGGRTARLLACENGLVDLSSGELLPHTSNYFNLNALDYAYEQDAPPPVVLLSFLNSIWGDDPECIDAFQMTLGLFLTADTSAQKLIQLIGPPRSGKGTIAHVIRSTIGSENVCAPSLHQIHDRFGLVSAIGKQAMILSEARFDRGARRSAITDALLRITGEDVFTIDRKNREPWTGVLECQILIQTNEPLELSDDTGALLSRLIVLPLTRSFVGEENFKLKDELASERGAILRWAIDGFQRLQMLGGRIPQPASGQEILKRTERLLSPIASFIEECCELDPRADTDKTELYDAYRNWTQSNGSYPLALARFTEKLQGNYPVKAVKGVWIDKEAGKRGPPRYRGLRHLPEAF